MKLLSGSEVAAFVQARQIRQVRNLRQAWRVTPRLAIVIVGDNPVIERYVRVKQRYLEDILVEVQLERTTMALIGEVIDRLNTDPAVTAIIIQLPLPDMQAVETWLDRVRPDKDVDGLGRRALYDPATPTAINWLLAAYGVELARHRLALVGHGRLVGAPLARLWRASGYDVTVFDDRDHDMAERLPGYGVVVTATGVPGLITSGMLGQGAVVVDAGTTVEAGRLRGDVVEAVRADRQDLTITPVRGGVGPLTVAALAENVISAARRAAAQKAS